MAPTTQEPSGLILWDVIEEHLDEAEFLFERWNRALFLPGFNLREIARTLEPRLFAHIDALSIAAHEVAGRVLLPALHCADAPARATVAALALLADPEGSWDNEVIEALQQTEAPLKAALIRALILTESPLLDSKIQERYRASPDDSSLLQVLTGRGLDPGALLRVAMDSQDPSLASAARNAVQRFGRREFYYAAKIDSRDGSPLPAYELKAQLQSPDAIEAALWNLGYCGTVEAGDICASYLGHPNVRLRKLAADSIAWIGGFNPRHSQFKLSEKEAAAPEAPSLPPFHEDDLGANLELDGVDALPIPNAAAILGWWQEHRAALAEYRRGLLGRPFSLEAVGHALREGALWRRHSLAVELCTQSDGRRYVATDVFSSRQFRQIAALVA